MISFENDPAVTDALRQWRGRDVFPTDLSSAQLTKVARELRERIVFAARLTNAHAVQRLKNILDQTLSGEINQATGRWEMMKELKALGYDPAKGFPQDMADVPPAEKGSLRDISSARRLNLMIETNLRLAANYGRMIAGNRPDALFSYPAWELGRLYLRDLPRGTPESHSVGWQRRWSDAGASVEWEGAVQGRLVARKNSPIWQALGDGAGGYSDTLGNPYPPFAFQSGMAWEAVPRSECEKLGLIVQSQSSAPMEGQLSPTDREVKAAFDRLSPELQAELRRELAEAE